MKPTSIVAGSALIGTLFVPVPAGAVQLNEAWNWPRWQIAGGRGLGSCLVFAGIVVYAYCSGLYRFSRNPMYVAQVAYLLGLFVYRGELSLALYAAIFAGAIHTSVVRTEEPELRQRFGEEYVRYTQEVPRWLSIWPRGPRR